MRFRRMRKVTVSQAGDEWIVFDGIDDYCHILNATAGWLLFVAEDFLTLDAAVASAQERFTMPADIDLSAQIRQAILELAAKQMLEVRDDDQPGVGGDRTDHTLHPNDMAVLYGKVTNREQMLASCEKDAGVL